MSETQKYWFAARTRDKQEFAICKSLSRLKSEEHLDVDYYLPTRIVVSQLKYRRKRSEVPVIRNLVFIRTTKQTACDISNIYNVPLFYMKDLSTHSMLVVPDKQMEDFRFLLDFSEEAVEMTNENIKAGDLVRVVKGSLRGMEGELIRHKGVTKVLVRIDMLGCAMVNIPASFVEKLNK